MVSKIEGGGSINNGNWLTTSDLLGGPFRPLRDIISNMKPEYTKNTSIHLIDLSHLCSSVSIYSNREIGRQDTELMFIQFIINEYEKILKFKI